MSKMVKLDTPYSSDPIRINPDHVVAIRVPGFYEWHRDGANRGPVCVVELSGGQGNRMLNRDHTNSGYLVLGMPDEVEEQLWPTTT